jgi:hypothetical protein
VCGSEIKDGRASLQDKFKITPYDKNILKLFLSETTKALTADMDLDLYNGPNRQDIKTRGSLEPTCLTW